MIAHSRGKTAEQVRELIDHGPYTAEQAKEKGLIDVVQTREEFLTQVRSDLGGSMQREQSLRPGGKEQDQSGQSARVLLPSFRDVQGPDGGGPAEGRRGCRLCGRAHPARLSASPRCSGPTSAAFGGDIRKALEKAAKDESVKAVVLRVDSPGGSVEASEVILNAARQVKAKKPLIVSMGDVAASGGYYVACGADAIFADEATITASIGVVGGKLVTTDLWNKLGVNWVGHKRGANADLLTSTRPFDDGPAQSDLRTTCSRSTRSSKAT